MLLWFLSASCFWHKNKNKSEFLISSEEEEEEEEGCWGTKNLFHSAGGGNRGVRAGAGG